MVSVVAESRLWGQWASVIATGALSLEQVSPLPGDAGKLEVVTDPHRDGEECRGPSHPARRADLTPAEEGGAVSVPGQLPFRRGPSHPLAQGGPWSSPTALLTPTPHPPQLFLLVAQLSNFRGKLFFPGGILSPGWVQYLLTVKAISSSLAFNIPC